MKIKQETFERFVKAVKMDGSSSVSECILNFKDDGLHLTAFTGGQTILMKGHLFKAAFENYEAFGEVSVGDMNLLHSIIKRYSKKESILLGNQDPFLVLDGSKRFKVKMINKDMVDACPPFKEIEANNILEVKKEQLDEFIKDLNVVRAEHFKITISPKKATFEATADSGHECKAVFQSDMLLDNLIVGFGKPFMDALGGVSGDMKISFKESNYPVKVQHRTEQFNVLYLVAPRLEDVNEAPEEEATTNESDNN